MAGFPIITLIQPWASWVTMGWKTGETRTSGRLLKQLEEKYFFIHAGKAWDPLAIDAARPWLHPDKIAQTEEEFFGVRGHILAMALGGKMRPMAKEDEPLALIGATYLPSPEDARIVGPAPLVRWFLPLDRVDPLEKPMPVRGQQGVWYMR